jgi:peptide/nickel transport system substrate-binding protein
MNQKQRGFSLIAIIVLIFLIVGGISYFVIKNNQIGSVEYLKFKKIKQVDAKQALLNGDIDMYMGALPSEEIKGLQKNKAITLYPATSTMIGFFVNPAPSTATKFNPFSIKEVRYAMQFLVNREDLANNLFAGFAKPTLTDPWSEHPDYKNIKDTVDEMGISYNKEKAISMIKTAMEGSGAVMESGVWTYQKQPVNVIVSYFSGPQTLGIANLIKAFLEQAGFTVSLIETNSDDPNAKAVEDYSNAAELKWNIAVSGWTYYNQSKISNSVILSPYVSDKNWWKYENKEITTLEEKLGDIKTEEERVEVGNMLVQKYLEDSTCVWLLASESVSAARSEVKGLIQDKFIGISNFTNIREAYIPGKDTLIVGMNQTYEPKEGWNHWVVNSISMMNILNTIHDPEKWSEISTLEDVGFRWSFNIEGKDSNSIVDVPEDSYLWDVEGNKWVGVEKGKKAVTKVTYDLSKYVGTNWHDGEEITWADVVFNIAHSWDTAMDKKKLEIDDNGMAYHFEPIVGLRISGNNLEVYLNKWNPDKSSLLGIARIFQRVAPWEMYAATDDLVFNQRAYNYQYLSGSDKEDLNVVNPDHVAAIFKTLETFDFTKIEPIMTMGSNVYAQKSDLDLRVNLLKQWYAAHNHLYISDGPFYIDSFGTDGSINLKAFHDAAYPFDRGYWRQK